MFKLMIADDNPYFLKDLSEYIDWEIFDFELVGVYENGKDLLDAASVNMPNLVITDVSMPIMDGFELSSKLYQMNSNIIIVFISGFAEFSHAQDALKLGIFDYILKPLNNSNLLQCMGKVHQKLLSEQLLALEQLHNRSRQDYYRKIALSNYIGTLMFHTEDEQQIQENLSQFEYYPSASAQHYVACFSYSHYPTNDSSNLFSKPNVELFQLLLESSTSNVQIIPTLISRNTGVLLLSATDPSVQVYDLFSVLCIDMEVNLGIRINLGYAGPCDTYTELPALYAQAQQVHNNLLINSPTMPIASVTDVPLDSAEEISSGQSSSHSYGPNVTKMREYIEQHYTTHITTNDVARHVFLSANYANACFTSECGTSIFNYIVELRMKKALELLKHSNLPVTVIADHVGYSSKTSFYLAFKRYTGTSPTAYRTQPEDTTDN